MRKIFKRLLKYMFGPQNEQQSVFTEVEDLLETNKTKMKKSIYRKGTYESEILNYKNKHANYLRTVSHTRELNSHENLEKLLENDRFWDILIDWKSLLGDNIYLKRDEESKR